MATLTDQEIQSALDTYFKDRRKQYIGMRYVPLFGRKDEDSIEWDNTKPYEPLTVVLHDGGSYTSRQFVPAGIEIADTDYWAFTFNFNAQVEQYRQETLKNTNDITTNKNAISKINNILYNTITPEMFGAVGDGETDDSDALIKTFNNANCNIVCNYNYLHSKIINVAENVNIYGKGSFIFSDPENAAIILNNNVNISDITITGNDFTKPTERKNNQCALYINGKNNINITGVNINKAAASGVLATSVNNLKITDCNIQNTTTDGIHINGNSNNCIVKDNYEINTGDDSYACVSDDYENYGTPDNIIFDSNTTINSKARGIVNIGCKNVKIINNTIIDSLAGCITIAKETEFKTNNPINTIVNNNYISSSKTQTTGYNGIWIHNTSKHVISNNTIIITSEKNNSCIILNDCDNISIDNNYIESPLGILINANTNNNNIIKNIFSSAVPISVAQVAANYSVLNNIFNNNTNINMYNLNNSIIYNNINNSDTQFRFDNLNNSTIINNYSANYVYTDKCINCITGDNTAFIKKYNFNHTGSDQGYKGLGVGTMFIDTTDAICVKTKNGYKTVTVA